MKHRRFSRNPAAFLLIFVMTGLVSLPAMAREQRGLRACYGVVTFGRNNADIRLMQVASKVQRLPFYQNRTEKTPYCPAEVDLCQLRSFVVPGDLLLVGPGMDDFACATYISPQMRRVQGKFRDTIGFVPLAELREVPVLPASPSDWSGHWFRSAEAEIRIEPDASGGMKIAGQATYGAHDPERAQRGAVHIGDLEGVASAPRPNMIAIGEGYDGSQPPGGDRSECRARLRLFGHYLVVEDNGGCGGNNVSFTGIYVRLKQP